MNNEKEISFGAFDSELMHQEIFIPEGFEATIDGNKIILKKIESEDERIRKELIEHVKDQQSSFISAPDCRDKYEEEENNKYNSWLSWLEKQENEPRKVSIWKHWKDGICGNGEGKLIYLIKNGDAYSLSSSLGFECDYIDLSELDNLMLEKQGEQKPSDKVEPFDKYEGLTDFEKNLADICIGWIGEELGWKQYIKDNADVLLRIAVEKFNSVQDAPFKQNPAWSEEDEKIRQNLMSLLSDMRGHRIEESTYQKYYPWLKSLKERYAWKPSDEQIRALEYIIDNVHNTSYSCKIVKELLEQLKKLKGE